MSQPSRTAHTTQAGQGKTEQSRQCGRNDVSRVERSIVGLGLGLGLVVREGGGRTITNIDLHASASTDTGTYTGRGTGTHLQQRQLAKGQLPILHQVEEALPLVHDPLREADVAVGQHPADLIRLASASEVIQRGVSL